MTLIHLGEYWTASFLLLWSSSLLFWHNLFCMFSDISVDLSSPDRFPGFQEGFSPTPVSIIPFFFIVSFKQFVFSTVRIPHPEPGSVTKAWALSFTQANKTCATHSNQMLSGCFLVVDKKQIVLISCNFFQMLVQGVKHREGEGEGEEEEKQSTDYFW